MIKKWILALIVSMISTLACRALQPVSVPADEPHVNDLHTEEPSNMPSNSGMDGAQTFPDKTVYRNHVQSVPDPGAPCSGVIGNP